MNTLMILGFDTLLLFGYFFMHSGLASFKSKKVLQKILPAHLYRLIYSLNTAIYILVAAFFWKDSSLVIYQMPICFSYIALSINLLGWLMYFYSHLMYYDVGGVFGTTQLFSKWSHINPPRLDISSNGLKRYIRFPVHTAFIPMFLSLPSMTASTLLFAVIVTLYAWIGTYHHDYRYAKLLDPEYDEYKKKTGMILPKFKRFKIQKYDSSIPDSTPRKKSLPFILAMLAILVPAGFGIFNLADSYGVINNGKYDLFTIPLLHIALMFISSYIITIFWKNFKLNSSKKHNLEITECVAFGAGVSSAIIVGMYFLLNYIGNGILLNFAMAIPCWVLGLIVSNFAFYYATFFKPFSILKKAYISIYGG